jgi:hypothetical protein
VTLGAAEVSAGASLAVEGSGFRAGELVEVTLHSDPVVLGSLRADGEGTVRGTLTVPATVAAGDHTILLRGVDSGVQASAALRVLSSGPVTGPTSGGPTAGTTPAGALARTGGVFPLGLLGAGTIVVLVGVALRRRARRDDA